MALDKVKTDPEMGEMVHKALLEAGVETPMSDMINTFTDSGRRNIIENHFREIMGLLGLDLKDDSLCETPKRIAKMYVNEIFGGLDYKNFPKMTLIDNKMAYSTMLLEKNIAVKSVCEHHFLPFIGKAYVAYIPNNKVIGLSKINRLVEFFSRRPQVQERLTEQVFYALCTVLDTEDVAVCIKAEHSCVRLRGVEDDNSDTLTSRLGGLFYEGDLRNEFYHLIGV